MSDLITRNDGLQLDPAKVFLISGQEAVAKVGNRRGLSPAPTQRVVIAEDSELALSKMAELEPEFKILGVTSLAEYEEVVQRLRTVVRGLSDEWVVHEA